MIFLFFEGLLVFKKQNLEFNLGMAPQKKHAQKAQKVLNIIEEQAIVMYVVSPFQGIS